jgi:multidrug efflux system membrane fusion protein
MSHDPPPTQPTPRRGWRPVAWVLAAIAAGGLASLVWMGAVPPKLFGGGADPKGDGRAAKAVPIQAQVALQRDEPVIINGLGVVHAWNTVTVRSRVDGSIERIHFEEGAMVREGETLIELDQRPFIAARDQAEAKVAQDEALLNSAQADLVRTIKLSKNGYASVQLLDQQTAAVRHLESLIAADKAALENAETQFGYTVIKAPISGRLGLRSIDIGNLVRATDLGGVISITQVQPIAVLFTAPEQYLDQINRARGAGVLPVTAVSTDGKTPLATGQLVVVDNTVDVSSGSIRLKARFENEDSRLWPGQSVSTRLTIATIHDAIVVPDGAVLRGPSGPFVFVVKPDRTAELRKVEVAQIQDGWAVIKKGISAGEQVVTSGQYKVTPGSLLDVTSDDTKAANASAVRKGIE